MVDQFKKKLNRVDFDFRKSNKGTLILRKKRLDYIRNKYLGEYHFSLFISILLLLFYNAYIFDNRDPTFLQYSQMIQPNLKILKLKMYALKVMHICIYVWKLRLNTSVGTFFAKIDLKHFLKCENINSGIKFNNDKYYQNLTQF